jgi:hypothetical protein
VTLQLERFSEWRFEKYAEALSRPSRLREETPLHRPRPRVCKFEKDFEVDSRSSPETEHPSKNRELSWGHLSESRRRIFESNVCALIEVLECQ